MVEHDNTDRKPVNGAPQDGLLPLQNGVSYSSEHPETIEISDDENGAEEAMKKKLRIFQVLTVVLGALLVLSVICIIVLGVRHGSPTDQSPSRADPCPQGWIGHEAWCYYFSPAEATWNISQSNCSSQGGSLTAIDTPSEKNFLMKIYPADYWIGLWREEGQPWKWANGSDFNKWFKFGEDGYCAFLNAPNISSSFCENKRRWICRMPHLQA